jgi:hypothetical protein
MRKTWLIWLGVLVVVAIIVVVLASRGKSKQAATGNQTGKTGVIPAFHTTYETIAAGLAAAADDEVAKGRMISRVRRYTATGTGWVTSAEKLEDGSVLVQIDVDAPGTKADGPDVMLTVPAANLQGPPPAAGAKVDYSGSIQVITPDEHLVIELAKGRLMPPSK